MLFNCKGRYVMNGSRYFLDTNAIIKLLRGDRILCDKLESAEWVGISIISHLEFLFFPSLSGQDKELFTVFESRVNVVELSMNQPDLLVEVIRVKQSTGLKLPDAIIVASAKVNNALLLTEDQEILKRLPSQTTV